MKGWVPAVLVVLAAATLTMGLKCWQCTDCDVNTPREVVCEPNEDICMVCALLVAFIYS